MQLIYLTDQQRKALLDQIAEELGCTKRAHDTELLQAIRDLTEKAVMYDNLCR